MDWDDHLDKIKDRRKTQEKIIKDGIKKFDIQQKKRKSKNS